MRIRKWKKYKLSKSKFPTHVIKNGSEGVLKIGRIEAKRDLQHALGRDVSHMVEDDTPYEWIFKEPLPPSTTSP